MFVVSDISLLKVHVVTPKHNVGSDLILLISKFTNQKKTVEEQQSSVNHT